MKLLNLLSDILQNAFSKKLKIKISIINIIYYVTHKMYYLKLKLKVIKACCIFVHVYIYKD